MNEDKQSQNQPKGNADLDFNEADLEVVEISDEGLETVDQTTKQAKKQAKKTAKKLLSPEEKKRLRRKQILIIAGSVSLVLLILLIVPFSRWPILNLIGFRGNLQITTLDQTSKKPVTKAVVKLDDGSFGATNKNGSITFANTKLGTRKITVEKAGYANKLTTVTNGFGTTKSKLALKPIGIKLDVDVKNWLSDTVIEGATVSYNDSSAVSDKAGRASLIIPPTDQAKVALIVSAPGYLNKTVSTDVDVASREVLLVSSQKDYFISKRDGKFDIFSSNMDGSNQQKIIEATGKEDEAVEQFSVNRSNKQAVLVATREGKVQNGKIVAGVYLVDLEKSSLKKVDEGSDIQLLDWGDSSIAYTKSVPDLNYDDPSLSRVVNLTTAGKLSELAQANYFAVSVLAQNKVYYQAADAYRTIQGVALVSQDLASGAKKSYLPDRALRYASHASYGTLEVQDIAGANFELQIAAGTTRAIDHRPGAALSFASSPTGQLVAWSDKRDGQGALLTRDVKGTSDKTAVKAGGLTSPVRFVTDDLVIVRVATSQETADYIVSLSTGKISKIIDVSNVSASGNNSL